MNTYSKIVATSALVAISVYTQAATYTDPIGDLHNGVPSGANFTGFPHLDITSVEVNNTATDIIFKINLAGDPIVTDWGKYMIGLNTTAGGDSAGNGWGRPITMSGMDYWIGSWVDGGNGAELRKYSGTWGLQSATYMPNPDGLNISKNSSSVTLQFAFAGLGLTPGSSFVFDVFSSGGGGGDSAVDAVANPAASITDWGAPYGSQSTLSYTITQVPEPASLGLVGLGVSLMINRFRRR